MNDDKLIELFNGFLIKIVEYNTKCKVTLEHIEEEVKVLKRQIGQSDSKSIMQRLEAIDTNVLKKAGNFIEAYTKRDYSEQEIKDLGGHVSQVNELYKMGKWFKGKLAIFIGVILMIIAVTTFGEKITALLEIIGLIGS